MHYKRITLLSLGTALLIAFGLTFAPAATSTVSAQDDCATAQDSYTVGFANLTEDIVFTQLVREGIVETAEELGNVDIVLADNQLDGATALSNTENFITQDVDAIIHFQTDEAFGNVIMARARAADTPVFAIDIPMPGATFFGADNYYAGQLAGEALAAWVNENWDGQADAMLVLELPQSGAIPAARMQGMEEAFQMNVDMPIEDDMIFRLDSQNTQEASFQVVSDTLPAIAEDARIVAITINDGTALGTIAAAESAGRADNLMVVGQNADPSGQEEMIKENSSYLGATGYFPENYGSQLLPQVISILECEQVDPSIYVEHVFISADNVCEFYPENWSEFCGMEDMEDEEESDD